MAFSPNEVERTLRTIFRRCVECGTTTPACPSCPSGQICSLIPESCGACASMTCIPNGQSQKKSGPNVGAIAGGVVGGVFVVAAATFLVWWFFIRHKRRLQLEEEDWDEDDVATQKHQSQFNMQRSGRASVHTVNSVAASFLSRASNFIPIAYIPGVMNRDGRPDSNLNIPPVPPVPAARGPPSSAHSSNGDALFFRPGDLRDSTYSNTSSLDNRSTFFGRPSITPSLARSSVATYRDDAVVNPMPAQTVLRGKANVVSVKNSQANTPLESPQDEVDAIDFGPTGTTVPVLLPVQSDGTTLSSASYGKPTLLTLQKKPSSGKGRFPVAGGKPNVSSPLAVKDNDASSDTDSFHSMSSPFKDNAQTPGGLSAVIEEATKRASRIPRHSGLGGTGRDMSPFGDEHEA
ncbi:hypothetical protein MBLNU459_g2165t1 [Dothideomycetes sp. NU459]